MAAITYDRVDFKFPKRVFLFLLLCVCALAAVGYANSHAVIKHGIEGYVVRWCMQGEPDPHWYNPESNYWARWCELPDGNHAVQILERVRGVWEERTAFIRRIGKLTRTTEEYLVDCGYVDQTWFVP